MNSKSRRVAVVNPSTLNSRYLDGDCSQSFDDETRHLPRATALRARLAAILGQDDLEEGLRVFATEGPSCSQLGAQLGGIRRGNACRWKERFRARLRKAVLAAAWRNLPQHDEEALWAAELLGKLKTELIAQAALDQIEKDRTGAAIDPTTAQSAKGDFWCVALASTTCEFLHRPTRAQIADYVNDYADMLDKKGHHLGAWFDHGRSKWSLEVTVLRSGVQEALGTAVAHGQRYVFNLATKQLLSVSLSGQHAAA
ncbi:MAG TPA: hypothetical protein VE988_03875 [Gemmataceae bacterium]|nr:hypothetical protein [Gemmataceae bacterium]